MMQDATAPIAVSIEGLRLRTEGRADDVFTLDVPHLKLRAGGIVALMGPTGAGKSTVLELLALLRKPVQLDAFKLRGADGSVCDVTASLASGALDDVADLRQRAVGYVPQGGGILPFLTARENATLQLDHERDWQVQPLGDRFAALAEALGLGPHMCKMRVQLSGGQRKRVALLRGLSVPRQLLLVDEPTSGLDRKTAYKVMELLNSLCREEGTCCVAATHDEALVAQFGWPRIDLEVPSDNRAVVPHWDSASGGVVAAPEAKATM